PVCLLAAARRSSSATTRLEIARGCSAHMGDLSSASPVDTSLPKTLALTRQTWSSSLWRQATLEGLRGKAETLRRGPGLERFAPCRPRRGPDGAAMICEADESQFKV